MYDPQQESFAPRPEQLPHRPRVGDVVIYDSTSALGGPSTVVKVHGCVCDVVYPSGRESSFIWAFGDGRFNRLHDWPAKTNPFT